MKKLALICSILIATCFVANAQTPKEEYLLSEYSKVSDTINDAGSISLTKRVVGGYQTGSLQIDVDSISGTVGGYLILKGSNTGAANSYLPLTGTSADSLTITNTGHKTYYINIGAKSRKYIMLEGIGTGTMSAKVTAVLNTW